MPVEWILRGVANGAVDTQKREVHFTLSVKNGPSPDFVGDVGTIEQITAALATMARELRQARPQSIAAESVKEYMVQRDAYGGPVILRLVTGPGVPHTFALPTDAAIDIAVRLKSESDKQRPVGHA